MLVCFGCLAIAGDFPMDCPLHDSLLKVHYRGKLLNEEKTVFYDTRVDNNGEPLEFSSGEGLVSPFYMHLAASIFLLFLLFILVFVFVLPFLLLLCPFAYYLGNFVTLTGA